MTKTLKDIITEKATEADEALFGLTDFKVKFLHYFLKQIIGIEYYNIDIDIEKREVRIQVTDHEGASVKISVSQESKDIINDFLTHKLNIKGKVIFL